MLSSRGKLGGKMRCLGCRKEKSVSSLFVRGRPVLKILYNSGLTPNVTYLC